MIGKWKKTKLQKRAAKKVKKERSMWQVQLFVGLAILTVLSFVGTAVWYGTRVESAQITQVEVLGGFTIPHTEIQKIVQQKLEGTYFKLVPRSFRPLYPRHAMLNEIRSIPRMKNVRLEVVDTQKVIVVFEEYQPASLWCADAQTNRCLFMDSVGFAFSPAPELTGSAFVRYVDAKHAPEEKTQGFKTDFIKTTKDFSERLASELDLYVTYIEKVGELDVLYTVSGGGVLKVSQRMTAEESFKNLSAILGSEDFIHLQNGAFQYIDLRFGDKIFLNEVEVKEEVSTSTDQ